MSTDPARAAMAEAAETIRAAAREHKRLERHHRKEAQALMGRLADLRAQCARAGIDFDRA